MVIISNTSYFQSVHSPTMPFISEVSKSDSYSLPLSLGPTLFPLPLSSPPAGLNAFPNSCTPIAQHLGFHMLKKSSGGAS